MQIALETILYYLYKAIGFTGSYVGYLLNVFGLWIFEICAKKVRKTTFCVIFVHFHVKFGRTNSQKIGHLNEFTQTGCTVWFCAHNLDAPKLSSLWDMFENTEGININRISKSKRMGWDKSHIHFLL